MINYVPSLPCGLVKLYNTKIPKTNTFRRKTTNKALFLKLRFFFVDLGKNVNSCECMLIINLTDVFGRQFYHDSNAILCYSL